MDLRERPFQKKKNTQRKGGKIPACSQRDRMWLSWGSTHAVGQRSCYLARWDSAESHFQSRLVGARNSDFWQPHLLRPRTWPTDRGREEKEDARAEKAAASRADPPEAAEPGRPATLRGRGELSADPGRRRRPQRHPAHSQDFLKWVRLPSDFYGLNSAIKSNHSRIKQNKISSTRHSCRKVFSKNTR